MCGFFLIQLSKTILLYCHNISLITCVCVFFKSRTTFGGAAPLTGWSSPGWCSLPWVCYWSLCQTAVLEKSARPAWNTYTPNRISRLPREEADVHVGTSYELDLDLRYTTAYLPFGSSDLFILYSNDCWYVEKYSLQLVTKLKFSIKPLYFYFGRLCFVNFSINLKF